MPTEAENQTEVRKVKCVGCGEMMDAADATCCVACGNAYCDGCLHECDNCGESVCDNCLRSCSNCGSGFCNACSIACSTCGRTSCPMCVYECYSCGDSNCSRCSVYCSNCDNNFCPGCYDSDDHECNGGREIDLSNYTRNPFIADARVPIDYSFHKKAWENTLYLGLELEVNFTNSNWDAIVEASKKHLKNRFVWKEDGSVCPGGELILTPHTLQCMKDLNFKGFLDDLKKAGATSYDSGQCGLHVHVNREALGKTGEEKWNTINNLRTFFWMNKEFVRKFSARTQSQLDSWSRIHPPDSGAWGERYTAVNTGPSNTIEFRCFRGTLNYERFKASIEFCDAIVNFCRSIKPERFLKFQPGESLERFTEYVDRNAYPFLKKRLTKLASKKAKKGAAECA